MVVELSQKRKQYLTTYGLSANIWFSGFLLIDVQTNGWCFKSAFTAHTFDVLLEPSRLKPKSKINPPNQFYVPRPRKNKSKIFIRYNINPFKAAAASLWSLSINCKWFLISVYTRDLPIRFCRKWVDDTVVEANVTKINSHSFCSNTN